MTQLSYIEVETQPEPTAAVIWLHGLGANGHDFEPVVPELQLPMAVRFIFPHAPHQPVTINGGAVMPSWYDILSIQIERSIDTEQIMESAAAVTELIEQEVARGIPSNKIVIAGFSQGGAVAYQTALSYAKPLAGVIALSTYFATKDTISIHKSNENLPILIGHGLVDDVVPEILGRQAVSELTNRGYTPDYINYPIPHSVCMEEIHDISAWLQKHLL